MQKVSRFLFIVSFMVLMSAAVAQAGDWRFPLGLAYVSGLSDVKDRYEENLRAEGYITKTTDEVPVGLMFQPYYQFDSGFAIGTSLGPVMGIFGDRTFFDFPVGVDGRFFILPSSNVSPYLRAGIKKHFVTGDYVEGSDVGFYGGVGIEFFRLKRVGLGLEFTIDTSEVTLEKKTRTGGFSRTASTEEDVKPSKYIVSLSAIF